MISDERLHLLRHLDLSGVAISAIVDPDGRLGDVDDRSLVSKLRAAGSDQPLPRIHTVVVSTDQTLPDDEMEYIHPKRMIARLLGTGVHVLRAENIDTAIDLMSLDARMRWGEIPDYISELQNHQDLVERPWLTEIVKDFVEEYPSGYLVLSGGPFFGKSAFVAAQHCSNRAIVHFVGRSEVHWDESQIILCSLSAQLRREHALPLAVNESPESSVDEYHDLLTEVSKRLEDGQKEVIYVDGLDKIAGLDEVISPTGTCEPVKLQDVFPLSLPPGIYMVLTSRPGHHLELWNPNRCKIEALDSMAHDISTQVEREIRAYVKKRSAQHQLDLEDSCIDRLVDATRGYIGVAALYSPQELAEYKDKWQTEPARLPGEAIRRLRSEWQRLMQDHPMIPGEHVKVVLGLLATAHDPLSLDGLDAILRKARGLQVAAVSLDERSLHDNLKKVLQVARAFVFSSEPEDGLRSCYRFYHSSFPTLLLNELSHAEKGELRKALHENGVPLRRQVNAEARQTADGQPDPEVSEPEARWRRRIRSLIGTAVLILSVAIGIWWLWSHSPWFSPRYPEVVSGPVVPRVTARDDTVTVSDEVQGEPRVLPAGDSCNIKSGGRVEVDATGRAVVKWDDALRLDMLAGCRSLIISSEMVTGSLAAALTQTTGTARYRLGPSGEVDALVQMGWLDARLADASGKLDVIISFAPDDPAVLWLGVLEGTVSVRQDRQVAEMSSMQAAFFEQDGHMPAPIAVQWKAPQSCYESVDRRESLSVSLPWSVCCVVDEKTADFLDGPASGTPAGDALPRNLLVDALHQTPDGDWLEVALREGGLRGWVHSESLLCTGPVPRIDTGNVGISQGTEPPAGNEDTEPPPGDDTKPPPGGEDTEPPPGGDTKPPPGGDDTEPPPGGDTKPPPGDDDTKPPPGGDTSPPPGGGTDPTATCGYPPCP